MHEALHRCVLAALVGVFLTGAAEARRFPNVVLVTVDTLRADRMSAYGYERATTPEIDALLDLGARFDQARTVEPLTNPALSSLITSRYPHEHGASRNGLRMQAGLESIGKILSRRGFATAAFVGNWTLKDEISGLGEHFELYQEVFSRKRWLFLKGEATADDLTAEALAWVEEQVTAQPTRPFFLWVHYVEPHAPYRLHESTLPQLGLTRGDLDAADRYDTEVAYVDASIGRLLAGLTPFSAPRDTLTVFAADHGESLGEHRYWGHGRNLYEPTLRVPLGLTWPGRIPPLVVAEPVTLLDVAPTVLGLLGYPEIPGFRGQDLTPVLSGRGRIPPDRRTFHQAHKGAVQPVEDARLARRRGLLQVGVIQGDRKEILDIDDEDCALFLLERDPRETRNLCRDGSTPSPILVSWLQSVEAGLESADALPPPTVDAETAEQMRALGYLD